MNVRRKGTRGLLLRLLALPLALAQLCVPHYAARAQDTRPTTPPTPRHSVMPAPASLRILGSRMKVEQTFSVAYQGHTDARLQAGVERALRRLEQNQKPSMGRPRARRAGGDRQAFEPKSPPSS